MRRGWLLPALLILSAATTWANQPAAAPSPSQAPGSAASPGAKIDLASGLPMCPSALLNKDAKPIDVGGEMVERVGDGVTPPQVTKTVKTPFPNKSHKEMQEHHVNEAEGVLAFVVGVDGKPKDICIEKPAGFDLDAAAAGAAMKSRFRPALKSGRAVPVVITFETKYRLFQR